VAVDAGAPEHRHHRLGGGDDALHGRFPAVHGDELDPHHQRGDGEEDDPDAARYPWCELKNQSQSGRAAPTQFETSGSHRADYYLLFLKRLDDLQTLEENKATRLHLCRAVPLDRLAGSWVVLAHL